MSKPWSIDNNSGDIQYPKGEVVLPWSGVTIMPIYVDHNNQHFIQLNGKLVPVQINPYNGYAYPQI